MRSIDSALSAGESLGAIGNSSGIPTKIDTGGSVSDPRSDARDYFTANTDEAPSGTGVYETSSYTLAGILARASLEGSFIDTGSCWVNGTCDDPSCIGEEFTYVYPAISAYCSVASSTRLCANMPPPPDNLYSYSASNTDTAQQNTNKQTIALNANDKLVVGTCGLTNASFVGDTFLRLLGPSGSQVAYNDDECGGRGSKLEYTTSQAGSFEIHAGCYGNKSCSGTVAYIVQ